MTDHTDTPRIETWKLILTQIEEMQVKIQEFGCQAVVDHYSTDDGIAGLQGSEFINGCASRVTLEGQMFGAHPDMIALTSMDGLEEVVINTFDGDATMRDAAMQIFDNICEYVYATCEPGSVIDGFDLRLEKSGGIEVDVINEASRPWPVPSVTNSMMQLDAWFDREVQRLSYEVTDRFTELLTARSAELAAEYPGLELTTHAGHGMIRFSHNYEGRRVKFDNMRYEELNEAYPGLAEQLEEIQDFYNKLDVRVMATDFGSIRVRPEPAVDETPEP